MKPPIEPSKDDCCNSGCNPCIFDVYQRQLENLKKTEKEVGELSNIQNGISDLEYTIFVVVDIVQLCNSLKIIKFKNPNNVPYIKVWWNPGDHFLLKYISNEQSQCTRAYTPIKLKMHENEDFSFLVVVKKYNEGVVSNYLFNLEIGALTIWRGPYGHYKIEPNKYSTIFMIAQGTGIAPFMSIIDNVLSDEEDMTKLVLSFCCRSMEEVLFRNELYNFNAYWNFSYRIYLSNVPENVYHNLKYEEPIFFKKFELKELHDFKPFSNNQFLLCGSHQFMKYYEKDLKNENYSENIVLF